MVPPHPLPPKKEVALALLERSNVYLHLDPRAEGVVVPAWFKKQPQLVLQIGLNMPVPIPDLRVDDDGISGTLSFSRTPFFCVMPWSSVFAMVADDGHAMVWPDDVPPEIARQAQAQARAAAETAQRKETAKRTGLQAVKSDAAAPAPAPKARKTRKKPVAVPAAEVTSTPTPSPAPAADADAAPSPEPAPTTSLPNRPSPGAAPRKPKRELPPYLRVVK